MHISEVLSGEWMLRRRSNGGVVVFFRAAYIALELYLIVLVFRELVDPKRIGLCFDAKQARLAVHQTIPWFCATLGAVYAWLYARFSSQWQYLADLYNRIVEVQVQKTKLDSVVLNNWRAAFIEDAYTLHLACKPMFASAINEMLKKPEVKAAFLASTINGAAQLASLRERFLRKGLSPFEP